MTDKVKAIRVYADTSVYGGRQIIFFVYSNLREMWAGVKYCRGGRSPADASPINPPGQSRRLNGGHAFGRYIATGLPVVGALANGGRAATYGGGLCGEQLRASPELCSSARRRD